MTFAAFQKELERKKIRPVYLFAGKEDFLAETGIRSLVDMLITPEDKSLNYVVYYGKDAESLPETLFTPPIFSSRKVTVVRQAQDLSGRSLDAVEKYVKNPPKDGCLIMWTGDEDKRKKFYKKVSKLVDTINCARLRENQLGPWINEYSQKIGKKIESKALAQLCSINWPSVRDLASEIDRLGLMVEDVKDMGGGSFAFDRWILTDAVASGNKKLATEAVRRLYMSNIKPTQIIGDLYRLIRNLWIIKWFQSKRQINRAKDVIGLPPFVFNRYCNYTNNVTRNGLEDGILRLLEADLAIKRGLRKDELELGILISILINMIRGK